MTTILVVCGAGASSTFLAASLRRIAKARAVELTVQASSDGDIDDRLATTDVLLVGAHLASSYSRLGALAERSGVASALLDPSVFAPGGAESAFDLALQLAATRRPALVHPHAPAQPQKDTPHG
jgi:PTS system cellobiose-specific IIB component